MIYDQFLEAGYPIFGLHGINKDGSCACGNPNCKAAGKHPILKQWQYSPLWSDEQLETMQETGQLSTGYGVLCTGLIVIDIDPRNGGNRSYKKLAHIAEQCQFVVATGGGGKHLYFKAPEGVALVSHLPEYKGIDFKSNGYVVGPGSIHASGKKYKVLIGSPFDISDAPRELIELLRKPETNRAEYNGFNVDFKDAEIADMLSYIDPDSDYDIWIRAGMAIHNVTAGTGLGLWDEWSSKGSKYKGASDLDNHWHSFGHSERLVGIGTLIHYAELGGWSRPVTFESDFEFVEPEKPSPAAIDLLRPPGFVGELTQWINDQCRYPREHLSVAAALVAMGNIAGLRYIDDVTRGTANLFAFCVAGSATGKEAVQQAMIDIHRAAGIHFATHGSIKSQQEIVRNLIRHQASYYIIDEIGYLLQKIANARKSGGAIYMDSVIAELMAIYSKANGYYLVTGDQKEEMRRMLYAELSKIDDERGDTTTIQRAIDEIDNGIRRPFLSLIGFTTPVTFDSSVDYEQATNGFIGRSLLFIEKDTNPRMKRNFIKSPMPESMSMTLAALHNQGDYEIKSHRVEYYGEPVSIFTDNQAKARLEEIQEEFHQEAEKHRKKTTLEALSRRAFEMTLKISLILAIPSGIRTLEMIEWAAALVRRDLNDKTTLAYSNMHEKSDPMMSLKLKILNKIDCENGMTVAALANRLRRKHTEISHCLQAMENDGSVKQKEETHIKNGQPFILWYAVRQ